MDSDFVNDGMGLSGGWEQHGEGHDTVSPTLPDAPAEEAADGAAAGAPAAPAAAPAAMFKPILRGTIAPLAGGGPRKYTWVGNWAMSGEDPLKSGFRYSFDLPVQYMGPPLTPGAVPANPLLPSNVAHQPLEIPVSGFFLSKDKGPDAEPTKYTEAALKMRVGGPVPAGAPQLLAADESTPLPLEACTGLGGGGVNRAFGRFSFVGAYHPATGTAWAWKVYEPLPASASKSKAPRPKAPVIPVDPAAAAAAALDRERRRVAAASAAKLTGVAASLYQHVIMPLRRNKAVNAAVFENPVDPVVDNCPGYFEVVKTPMCLATVEERLRSGAYGADGHAAFAGDMRLIASNARLYNPPGHWVHAAAVAFEAGFEELYTNFLRRQNEELVKAELRNRERARAEKAAAAGGGRQGGDDDGAGKKRRQGGGGGKRGGQGDDDEEEDEEEEGGQRAGGGSKKARKAGPGAAQPPPMQFSGGGGGAAGGTADTAMLQQQLAHLTSVVQQLVQVSAQTVAAGHMAHMPNLAAGPGSDMASVVSLLSAALQQQQQQQNGGAGGGGSRPPAAKSGGGGGGRKKSTGGGGRKGRDDDDDDGDDDDYTGSGRRQKGGGGGADGGRAGAGGGRKSIGRSAAPVPVAVALTFEEKKALSEDVMLLSPQDTDRLLQIISERTAIGDTQGEVELDIDSLDTATLRHLQRFVAQSLGKAAPPGVPGVPPPVPTAAVPPAKAPAAAPYLSQAARAPSGGGNLERIAAVMAASAGGGAAAPLPSAAVPAAAPASGAPPAEESDDDEPPPPPPPSF